MEIRTKQRLIGGLVLLAVVAIFLPLLFHNPHPSTNSLSMPTPVVLVPPAPSKPVVQLQLPPSPSAKSAAGKTLSTSSSKLSTQKPQPLQMPAKETAVLTVSDSSVPEKIKPKKISGKPKPHPTQLFLSTSPPEAWVIQVASFSDSDNAKRLLNQLRARGFDAYSCQSKGKKTIIRVFIGPDIDRNKIDQIQKELKQQLQLNGVIRKYVVF